MRWRILNTLQVNFIAIFVFWGEFFLDSSDATGLKDKPVHFSQILICLIPINSESLLSSVTSHTISNVTYSFKGNFLSFPDKELNCI